MEKKIRNINYRMNPEYVKKTHSYYNKKYPWTINQIMKLLKGREKEIGSILEIGVNYGGILMGLKKIFNVDCVGADLIDFKELKEKYGYNLPFIQVDLNKGEYSKLPQKDLIVMIDILEHLDDPAEVLRKLPVKKYLLYKIPLEKSFFKNIFMALGFAGRIGLTHPSGHIHGYYLKEGLALAKKGNLKIVDHFYTFNPLFLNYPNLHKGFTLHKKMFYLFDTACKAILPKKVYLWLFGGTLLVLCERAK